MTISKDIKDRLIDGLITAFIFAAALSWRETLVQGMQLVLPENTNAFWSELIVSSGITAIVITVVYILLKTNRVVDSALHLTDEEDRSQS